MAKRHRDFISYEDVYNELAAMNIPVLTLDKGWHELFPYGKTKELEALEKKLNNAMKNQGRVNFEKKELKQLKQTLINQIVDNMDAGENSRASKKLEKSKELIEEINDKLILLEDSQLGIPTEIKDANVELLMEGMRELCEKTIDNGEEIDQLEALIEEARLELKKKILLRETKIEENEKINKFLNKTVGKGVVKRYEEFVKRENV